MKSRRHFLKSIAASTAAAGFPLPIHAAGTDPTKLRIGIITDVHKDVIHDADARLQTFVDAMRREQVDAIIQLGDFCIPKPANRAFLAIFNQFSGPRYHVLGNHDMDGGFTRDQAVAFLGMKSRSG
jgi:predicted phosphodiesterase